MSPLAMAASSSLPTLLSFPSLHNSPKPPKPSIAFPIKSPQTPVSISSHSASSRVYAAPEVLEETLDGGEDFADVVVGGAEPAPLEISGDGDKIAPKQKIRIKLRSYWVSLMEDSCKQIMDAARNTNAKTMGPVPLPTKKRIYCVLKSPHVHKDARFHFEIRTHQRLIDILYPTAQTIDSLMQLDLPAGVDVEVKL